ncbi:MAG: hypothetical protein ACLSAF_21680 [Intestinimonas sp.]
MRYHAGLIVLPEHDMAVAVLSSGGVSTYNQLAGARILVDALAQRGITVDESWSLPEAEPARLPQAVLSYAGTYAGLTGMLTASFDEAGALTLAAPAALGGAPMTLTYYDDGSFRDEEETLLVKFIPEENGRVYLYEKAYSDIPGLVPLGAASYAHGAPGAQMGRRPKRPLAAWEARGRSSHLIANEKYVLPGVPLRPLHRRLHPGRGARLRGPGPDRGCGHRAAVSPAPRYREPQRCGLYGAGGGRHRVSHCGRLPVHGLRRRPPPLGWGGGLHHHPVRWPGPLVSGRGSGGRDAECHAARGGGFYVCDQLGQVVAGSWAFGDTHALLPEGGWIVFAGEPGTRFPLSVTEEAQ